MNLSLETVLRCLDLVPIVRENQGITLDELSQRMNVPLNVIVDQLIPSLMLCGSPPYMPHDYINMWMDGDRVYVSFAEHFRRPVTLLPLEVTALHLALNGLNFSNKDREFAQKRVEELRNKIELALPPEQRQFLRESERICVNANPRTPLLALVNQASVERKKLSVEYLSTGESSAKTRVIHPYGVVIERGSNYVISHCETRGKILPFRLDRMHAVDVLEESFSTPPRFSLERYARGGIFSRNDDDFVLKARITGQTARLVEDSYPAHIWKRVDKDTVRVTMPTSRLRAAVRRILALGEEATIEGPPEAVDLATSELDLHLESYAS